MFGNLGRLAADGPVVLAWGRDAVLDVEVAGQRPTRAANVLYYIPVAMRIRGATPSSGDLMRSTVLVGRRGVLQQGPVDDQLRPGHGDGRLPADPVRGHVHRVDRSGSASGFGGDTDRPDGGVEIAPIPDVCPRQGRGPGAGRLRQADCRPGRSSTACPRSRSSTGRRGDVASPAPPRRQGQTYDLANAGALRRSGDGHDPGPLRQRPPGSGRHLAQRRDRGDGR